MAPNIDTVHTFPDQHNVKTKTSADDSTSRKPQLIRQPLKYSGTLDSYEKVQATPAIGVEFPELQLSSILGDDAKVRDLAITSESVVIQGRQRREKCIYTVRGFG